MKILNRTRLLTVALLVCLATLLASCGQQGDLVITPSPKITSGPNDNLSNTDLLKMAVVNMRALESYHFEFKGGWPSESPIMSLDMVITGDLQFNDKGARVSIKDNGSGTERERSNATTLVSNGMERLYTPGDRGYISFDEGKTWSKAQVDTQADFLMSYFGVIWQADNMFTVSDDLLNSLTLKDGALRTEEIDGVHVRQITADVKTLATPTTRPSFDRPFLFDGAKTIGFWVSTELKPTVRQMRIEGSNAITKKEGEQPTDTPYTLTWKWSRFNEDFGEVKPPPAETIRNP